MFDYSFDYNIYRIQKNDYNNKYSKGINSYYYDFETTLTQIKKYLIIFHMNRARETPA